MILIMGTVITDIFLKSMCDVIYVYVSEKERNLATEGAIVILQMSTKFCLSVYII